MYRNSPDRNATLPCRNGDTCYFFRTGYCHFYHGPPLEDSPSSSQGPPGRFQNDGNNFSNPRGYICNRNPLNLMNDRLQRRDSYLVATNQSPAGGSHQYEAPVYNNPLHSPARSSHINLPPFNMMSPQQHFNPYNTSFQEHLQPNMRPDMSPQQGNSRRTNTRRRPSRFGPRSNQSSGNNSSSSSVSGVTLKRKGSPLSKSSKMAKLEYKEDKDEIEIEAFQCPISMEVMDDPVVAADGHSYERLCIEQWLRKQDRSPLNNTRLASKRLIPNHTLRKSIQEWNAIKLLLSPRETEKEIK